VKLRIIISVIMTSHGLKMSMNSTSDQMIMLNITRCIFVVPIVCDVSGKGEVKLRPMGA